MASGGNDESRLDHCCCSWLAVHQQLAGRPATAIGSGTGNDAHGADDAGQAGGFSAGANVAVALRLLQTTHPGATIAALICDSGLKYLSTDLWE